MPLSLNYLFRRLFWSIAVLAGVTLLSYLILVLSPGDPAAKWAGNPRGPGAAKAVELARKELGLDLPLHLQLLNFLRMVFTGDLGLSIAYKQPVYSILWRNLAATLELLFMAYIIGIPLGSLLGIFSALKRGGHLDGVLQTSGLALANTPAFWLGMAIFATLVPYGFTAYGRISTNLAIATNFQIFTGLYLLDALLQLNAPIFFDVLARLLPPALAVAAYPTGVCLRIVRTLMADALLEEHVRVAVAWGVKRRTVVWRYAFRATLPGLVQVSGLAFAYSLVDAMVVEYVFGREGLGRLLFDAISVSDFRLAIGLLIVVATFYLIINTVADVAQALIDPRVKL
ncbi:MAG: ABC transporter permease [Thermofilaceae archaeon]|nr:ABC transporter permease [Thermofilaceae archaeon]MCX8181120.1 ABC transporter permease [Thermofilaceae archaeon]MDW8004874.1 ABC transporter permease [Thermofilaceae archaeon]